MKLELSAPLQLWQLQVAQQGLPIGQLATPIIQPIFINMLTCLAVRIRLKTASLNINHGTESTKVC